jgi:hypothetical protein
MFKVGDKVEVVDGSRYSITTTGSLGKVIKVISPYTIQVDFTYLASPNSCPSNVFIIDASDLDIVTPAVVVPHQAVINKIKEMEARRVKGKVAKKKTVSSSTFNDTYIYVPW